MAAASASASVSADATPVAGLARQKPSRELRELLAQIDPERLKATVLKLTAFGTRHTLSSQTDPARGIGAATEWVAAQFEAVAARSGGRMTVQRQTFTQPVSPRIPVPTPITNVDTWTRGSPTS